MTVNRLTGLNYRGYTPKKRRINAVMNDELGLILRDLRGAKSLLAALGEQYAEGSTGTSRKRATMRHTPRLRRC